MGVVHNKNLGVAFAMTFTACFATALGASVVFVPSLVKYASSRALAASLGLSAGVMMFVSLVDILHESGESFVSDGYDDNKAFIYSILCFFGGVAFMVVFNHVVNLVLACQNTQQIPANIPSPACSDHLNESCCEAQLPKDKLNDTKESDSEHALNHSHGHHHQDHHHDHTGNGHGHHHHHHHPHDAKQHDVKDNNHHHIGQHDHKPSGLVEITPSCPCHSKDPNLDLENLKQMAEELQAKQQREAHTHKVEPIPLNSGHVGTNGEPPQQLAVKTGSADDAPANQHLMAEGNEDDEAEKKRKLQLVRMSIANAFAISLHNFPEGLATFVATLKDPKIGGVLAVAVALHSMPLGLCVSMPIYYASGDRIKAFSYALMSGLVQPMGAFLGWVVLAHCLTDKVYGVIYGLIAGMMVMISAKELLPTAHRYDPGDTIVTYSFVAGMAIMGLSLILFSL